MKKFLKLFLVTVGFFAAHPVYAVVPGQYGIHLFFNEKEYIDTMVISANPGGLLKGQMFVPKDFNGPLLNVKVNGLLIEFDLLVPKNSSRPKDMVFHYVGRYFDQSHNQIIGFVTLKGTSTFVASFTAFKRM